jgi:dUTPase
MEEWDEHFWRDVYLRRVKREVCLKMEKLSQGALPEINESLEFWVASPENWEGEFGSQNVDTVEGYSPGLQTQGGTDSGPNQDTSLNAGIRTLVDQDGGGSEVVIPGISDQATAEGTVDLREVQNSEEPGSDRRDEGETTGQTEEQNQEYVESSIGRPDNLDLGPQLLEWRVNQFEMMKLARTDPDAVVHQRMHVTVVGMDVSIIGGEEINRGVWKFRTGWAMEPPLGYFFQVTERSSLHESGWSLANKVEVIDPGYQGEVFIVMRKTAAAAIPAYPWRAVQILCIPHPTPTLQS